jgi:hypothetical protein
MVFTCLLMPKAASPCPSAIGCVSGECRGRAWLAGELTVAGGSVSKKGNIYIIMLWSNYKEINVLISQR